MLIALSPAGRSVIDEAIPAITRFEAELVQDAIDSPAARAAVEDGLRRLMVGQEPTPDGELSRTSRSTRAAPGASRARWISGR